MNCNIIITFYYNSYIHYNQYPLLPEFDLLVIAKRTSIHLIPQFYEPNPIVQLGNVLLIAKQSAQKSLTLWLYNLIDFQFQ